MPSAQIDNSRKHSRTRKVLLLILLILLTIAAIAIIYWKVNKKEIIKNKIQKKLEKKTEGLYKVNFDDMEFQEGAGIATFTNFKLNYDTARFFALKNADEIPGSLVRADVPLITIIGLQTPEAMRGKEVVASKIELTDPKIDIFYTNKGADASKNIPSQKLYRQLLGDLKLIKVDTLLLKHARITTRNMDNGKEHAVFSGTTVLLTDVLIDSIANEDPSRTLFSKAIDFNCENISWTGKKLYNYSVKDLSFRSSGNTMRIGSVNIIPKLAEEAFVKSHKYQADRMDISFADIRLTDITARQLLNETIYANKLEVNGGKIKVYRDLNIPRDNKSKVGTYPHQMIMKVPVPFHVTKAFFRNLLVEYKEKNDITGLTGNVRFENANIGIDNLTNSPESIRKNSNCRIDVTASLLGLTTMRANLNLPLGDKEGRFTVQGSVAGGDATKLNSIAVPMGMARIKEGTIQGLDFNLKGNNTHASGTIKILYQDLKLDLLEMDESKGGLDKKDFTSFIAGFVIKDENPKNNQPPRIAEVNHERDKTRSFYNLVWKSIMEGVNKSIGNKRKMQRP